MTELYLGLVIGWLVGWEMGLIIEAYIHLKEKENANR